MFYRFKWTSQSIPILTIFQMLIEIICFCLVSFSGLFCNLLETSSNRYLTNDNYFIKLVWSFFNTQFCLLGSWCEWNDWCSDSLQVIIKSISLGTQGYNKIYQLGNPGLPRLLLVLPPFTHFWSYITILAIFPYKRRSLNLES